MKEKLRILYDATYASRGKSGIPNDCRRTAEALMSIDWIDTSLLLSPKEYVPIPRRKKINKWENAIYLGSALRSQEGRNLPFTIGKILNFIQSLTPVRKVSVLEVADSNRLKILKTLGLHNIVERKVSISVSGVSTITRFARPTFLKPFKLKLKKINIFIQQQIDPISVPRKTKHIVRLHDVLPITRPEFFDQLSVTVFTKGLRQMLRNKNIFWVMDTKASAIEFCSIFNLKNNVFHVPCIVESDSKLKYDFKLKKDQILMVNTIEPRKNIKSSIYSFMSAKNKGYLGQNFKLIIVGSYGWLEKDLYTQLRNREFGIDVLFLENINDQHLEKLYQESKFTLSSSYAEGFGLPPLEGMLRGCIPLISKIPQHEENIGIYGVYFNPEENDFSEVFKDLTAFIENLDDKYLIEMSNYIEKNFSKQKAALEWSRILREIIN